MLGNRSRYSPFGTVAVLALAGAATISTTLAETGAAPAVSLVGSCTGKAVQVTPSNFASAVVNNDNAILNLQPGRYTKPVSITGKQCLEIRCTQSATVNAQPNMKGCVFERHIGFWRPVSKNIIVKNLVFVVDNTGHSPGSQSWDYSMPIWYVDKIRIEHNVFNGHNNHEISTKHNVGYAEVLNNLFVGCWKNCIDVGQAVNTSVKPDRTSGIMIIRGNTFDIPKSVSHAIVQRNNRTLIVENNTFRNVPNQVVRTRPSWKPYLTEGLVRIPRPLPLRTVVKNNTFEGNAKLWFQGRGVADDTVLVRDNRGNFTCKRVPMDAEVIAAHSNEQTKAPPKLDPASDAPC